MARPLIKWVGGKTQLLPEILKRIPAKFNTYYEPFIGGGAVFFALAAEGRFKEAVISDVNPELVALYRGVRDDVEGVIGLLQACPYSKEKFLELRAIDTEGLSDIVRAARFIYLNKTCFNGLWRVNKAGRFNVPFGKFAKPPTICDETNLRACAKALKNVTITLGDYREVSSNAEEGDVVYFDPPYIPLNATSSFTSYAADGFGMMDQCTLANHFHALRDRGVLTLLSNSDCPASRELYHDFVIHTVSARRNINSKASGRGAITEVLVESKTLADVGADLLFEMAKSRPEGFAVGNLDHLDVAE